MLRQLKSMLRRHCILNRLELRRIEFDDFAALGTDHVVVMLMLVVVLVMRAAIAKPHLTSQAGFRQYAQGPINRRLTDSGVFFAYQTIKVFARHVSFSFQEHFEDQITLRSALQPFLLDVF